MKKVLTIAVFAVLLSFLSACNSIPESPDEAAIKADIKANGGNIISSALTISDIEILDTVLDKDLGTIDFDLKVYADDGEAQYVYYMQIGYVNNKEEKAWDYSDLTAQNRDEWTVAPMSGVKEDAIKSDVLSTLWREQISIDGETWYVDEENLGSITVDNRNTQLEQSKETITVSIEINDEVLVAKGQLQLDYEYNTGLGWRMADYRSAAPFTASEKPEAALEVSDDEVLGEVLQMKLPFLVGSTWNPTTQQIVNVSADNVSGFSLVSEEVSDKGANRVYNYSFSVDKDLIVFDGAVNVVYNYSKVDGWTRDTFDVTLSVASVALEGTKWEGEHIFQGATPVPPPRPMTLEIDEIASNGATFATLTFEVDDNTLIHEMRGSFDAETLELELQFHDWISTPPSVRWSYMLYDFQRRLYVYLEADTLTMRYNVGLKSSNYHDPTLTYAGDID